MIKLLIFVNIPIVLFYENSVPQKYADLKKVTVAMTADF